MEQGDNYANAARVLTDEINGRYIASAVFHGSATLRTQVGGAVTNLLNGKVADADTALAAVINNTKADMAK